MTTKREWWLVWDMYDLDDLVSLCDIHIKILDHNPDAEYAPGIQISIIIEWMCEFLLDDDRGIQSK